MLLGTIRKLERIDIGLMVKMLVNLLAKTRSSQVMLIQPDVFIGKTTCGSELRRMLLGLIDEVRIWNRALYRR